jgi:hypothetical protein
VIAFIADNIVIKKASTGKAYDNSFGLAIYLPAGGYDANYSKLAWSAHGEWDAFIQWLKK